jgi:hypothetical protein
MVTTRTTPASIPIPTVRSRPTLSHLSPWVPSPPSHTSPRSPLLPIVLPIPRPPSTPLSPPPVVSRPLALVSPPAPPAPGPPLEPVLPTLPGATVALLPVSRSDPPSSPWASVPLVLSLPFSLWLKLRQQIYGLLFYRRKRGYRYTDFYFAFFLAGDRPKKPGLTSHIILHIFLFLAYFDNHFPPLLVSVCSVWRSKTL